MTQFTFSGGIFRFAEGSILTGTLDATLNLASPMAIRSDILFAGGIIISSSVDIQTDKVSAVATSGADFRCLQYQNSSSKRLYLLV